MKSLESGIPRLIFLSSMASLAFEVLLTRIFSITIWYHFAFMVISIAMLGFAASGIILAIYPGLKKLDHIGWYTLALGVAMPTGFLLANLVAFDPVRLAWERWELLNILLTYLSLALPFFCTGLVIATAFSVENRRAGLLYGADMVGAGFGSVGILLLMRFVPPETGIFVVSLLVVAVACSVGDRRLRSAAILPAGVLLVLLILQPGFCRPRMSQYKGLEAAMQSPGSKHLRTWHTPFARIDTFKSPSVRYAPGLSLRYQEPLPEQIGISIDGGDVNAVTAVEKPAELAFLDHLPAALPYAIAPRRKVLILDPRGGLPVLLARRHDADNIATVESVSALERIIREELRLFSGGLYASESRVGLGRSWLSGEARRFDLIDISLQGTNPSGSFGISENYRFTVEAFMTYLEHLTENGVLSVNLFIIPPPRTELRIMATLATALEEAGMRNPGTHLAALRSWGTLTILAKRSPFTGAETAAVRNFATLHRFDLSWLSGVTAEESNVHVRTRDFDYYKGFSAILSPAERDSFLTGYLFDVSPVRDESPFFSHFLRFDRIPETYRAMGGKWQFFLEGGYILPAVLVQAAAISALLLALPALAGKGTGAAERSARNIFLPYFALLGLAYMFVEVALIQKLILPLEDPSVAVSAVLASLLISSGTGSLLSHRYPRLTQPGTTLLLALLVGLCALLLPPLFVIAAPWPLPLRGVIFCLLVAIPGMLMGIPFPAGLKLLGQVEPSLIPWAWAVNGVFSVLAPLLAVMTAMVAGFRGVLLLGATAYLLAFLMLRQRVNHN
jgi:spermidine synthase